MKHTTLAAAALALLAQGAWAQVSFDGTAGASLPSLRFKTPAISHSISAEAKMAQGAKAAVVNILVVFKWADVPDNKLPMDPRKPQTGLLAKLSNPRVSRADLPNYEVVASGSGFVVRAPNGQLVLVSNHHVVDTTEAEEAILAKLGVNVKLELHIKSSSDQFAVTPFATDVVAQVGATGKHGMDIAFLKIPATRADGSAWGVLPLGDSSKVQMGEDVWALGFPEGLDITMTKGSVSAAQRILQNDPYVSYIQTDAAINPGNSGGPLVRIDGTGSGRRVEVVGMDTMIMSQSGGSNGLGFAIDSNTIKRALNMYIKTGSIDVGYVGIAFGRAGGVGSESVSVNSVAPGSPAKKAGLKAGDVIESVEGKHVSNNADVAMAEISRAIKSKDPGQTAVVVVKRGGRDVTIRIVVEKEPTDLQQP